MDSRFCGNDAVDLRRNDVAGVVVGDVVLGLSSPAIARIFHKQTLLGFK